MAVQIPDPGQGDSKTGDNEYVFRKKVQNNFSDQSNAASRLVGELPGNVAQMTTTGVVFSGWGGEGQSLGSATKADLVATLNSRSSVFRNSQTIAGSAILSYSPSMYFKVRDTEAIISCGLGGLGVNIEVWNTSSTSLYTLLHDKNTLTDSNGFIKSASPIVKLFADKIELNNEAEQQNIEFIKNGVGDYTIKNTSGLSTDGWYIELPNDANGNTKFAVIYDELADGTINIKTYKRKFDFELVAIVADIDNPIDITDGRWIDLRLNETEQPIQEV
ncbi:hypothetical protein [Psychrobacter sp. Rd 27.2]|uniref:phage tail fiber protein n=1 Tax=Psychrobacter sp. Rd 27.2 TaxID=1926479 RepID=UPI000946D7EF|nr:hypothetical protein [Psychrobacter sp. Rd 27.2]OLF40781.1 hypothetical protein BTV99_07075 [Psychrobacter sp. Rd 27.2]